MPKLKVSNAIVVPYPLFPPEIPREDIVALVDQLGLSKEQAARPALSAYALIGLQVMPKLLMQGPEDRAASRARLARISKLALKLEDELSNMGVLACWATSEAGSNAPLPNDPPFNLMSLRRQLNRLSEIAPAARDNLKPRKRGAQSDAITVIVMRQLMRITELATGELVEASKTRNSVYDPHLQGRGGAFAQAWFSRVSPEIGPTAIWRIHGRAKKQLRRPGVADEDAKWLQLSELALLSKVRPTR